MAAPLPAIAVDLSRRWFLTATLACGGAVVLAAEMSFPALAAENAAFVPPSPDGAYAYRPAAWVSFEPDGTVLIRCAKAEMGQGISTALPQILADGMDADWSRVRTAAAPLDDAFNDPRMQERDTGGSRSVRFSWEVMRSVGAGIREMMKAAAAGRLGAPVGELVAEQGEIVHPASGRRVGYHALAPLLVGMAAPEKPRLKQPAEFTLIGRSTPRLDIPSKVDRSARFTIDVQLNGMLTATVAQCPVFGGKVARVSDAAARAVRGVRDIAVFDTWVGGALAECFGGW